MYDIAVIIINYNTTDYTLDCIEAVKKQTCDAVSYQVIVVDNNSERPQYEKLRDHFPSDPHISLHPSPVNTGFGGGNMFGAQYADASYVLFLNNDAMLLNDCLQLLNTHMNAHPKVGVCTAQNYDEQGQLVPSFDHNKGLRRLLFGRGFLEKINPRRYPKRKKEYTAPLQVDWVNGAFLFFRKKAFDEIGGFDPNIFLYYEEMDLCHRLKKHGYQTQLVPAARILHYQGVSIGTSKAINKEAYLSYLYVLGKNHGMGKQFLIRLYLSLIFLLKPKKWYLLGTVLWGSVHKDSLRLQQNEVRFED